MAKQEINVARTFFRGLVVVLPVAVLLATLVWLARTAETLLGGLFKPFLPEPIHFPGMGVLIAILLCYGMGLSLNTAFARRLVAAWHQLLEHIPLIKSLYGAVEDIIDSFSQGQKGRFNRVVKVRIPSMNVWLVGFVTREDLTALPNGLNDSNEIAVYLPMSYQIGGYLVFIPRSAIEPLEMSVEDASRLVLTAGMSVRQRPVERTLAK
ncbi:MAG: hypothetical protein KCHDKBKB_01780 [Elusimicrobia bacterium]|nr:hypothetical protein [Elusimicrobiota bacterium]